MGGKKTDEFLYRASDVSDLQARFDRFREKGEWRKKFENPMIGFAEECGIIIGKDFGTISPFRRLLEGKTVSEKSAEVFRKKLGLRFKRIPRNKGGRPKNVCALEDMRQNGARIGVVPCEVLTNRTDGTLGMVPEAMIEYLRQSGIEAAETFFLSNRDVCHELAGRCHFVIGASPTPANERELKMLYTVSQQKLALLTVEEANPGDLRKIGVLAGSGEEGIVRSLRMEQSRIVGHSFGDPLVEYARLFERVQSGELLGAIATAHGIASWMTLHWQPVGFLGSVLKHMLSAEKEASKATSTNSEKLLRSVSTFERRQELPLTLLRGEELNRWLSDHLGCEQTEQTEQTVRLTSSFGIAVASKLSHFDTSALEKTLKNFGLFR